MAVTKDFKYEFNNFTLEGRSMHTDFSAGADIQFGADIHLTYAGKFAHKPTLGIMQFVKSQQLVGNPPMDPSSRIALDHHIVDGEKISAINYLFGDVNKRIMHEESMFCGEPTTIQNENAAEIYDCPREIFSHNDIIAGASQTITFFDFIAEFKDGYIKIYDAIGIVWEIELKISQQLNSCTVEVTQPKTFNFMNLPYDRIFANAKINPSSYCIINGNK